MTTEPCLGCGSDKTLVGIEPAAAWWSCPTCGISKEEATND